MISDFCTSHFHLFPLSFPIAKAQSYSRVCSSHFTYSLAGRDAVLFPLVLARHSYRVQGQYPEICSKKSLWVLEESPPTRPSLWSHDTGRNGPSSAPEGTPQLEQEIRTSEYNRNRKYSSEHNRNREHTVQNTTGTGNTVQNTTGTGNTQFRTQPEQEIHSSEHNRNRKYEFQNTILFVQYLLWLYLHPQTP